jgi:hypothetical protein
MKASTAVSACLATLELTACVGHSHSLVREESDREITAGMFRHEGPDSGVLTEGKAGKRSMHATPWYTKDKKGQFFLSFSYDWVKNEKGEVVCGFELFIRTPENKILGLGVGKDGQILKEVPVSLAHDKNASDEKQVITSGKGCFKCHPRVSYNNDKENAELFWGPKDARKETGTAKDATSHGPDDPDGVKARRTK